METKNKTLRFIVGCGVIYLAWQLADAGWFARIYNVFNSSSDLNGFRGGFSDLLLSALPYLVDTICLFGSIAIAVYGLIWKALSPFCTKLAMLVDAHLESYGLDLWTFDIELDEGEEDYEVIDNDIDVDALENALNSISERLDAIEGAK